jgi:hypothetical protein
MILMEAVVAQSKYYPPICVKERGKLRKTSSKLDGVSNILSALQYKLH